MKRMVFFWTLKPQMVRWTCGEDAYQRSRLRNLNSLYEQGSYAGGSSEYFLGGQSKISCWQELSSVMIFLWATRYPRYLGSLHGDASPGNALGRHKHLAERRGCDTWLCPLNKYEVAIKATILLRYSVRLGVTFRRLRLLNLFKQELMCLFVPLHIPGLCCTNIKSPPENQIMIRSTVTVMNLVIAA